MSAKMVIEIESAIAAKDPEEVRKLIHEYVLLRLFLEEGLGLNTGHPTEDEWLKLGFTERTPEWFRSHWTVDTLRFPVIRRGK